MMRPNPGDVMLINRNKINVDDIDAVVWPEEFKGTPLIFLDDVSGQAIFQLPLQKLAKMAVRMVKLEATTEQQFYDAFLGELFYQ